MHSPVDLNTSPPTLLNHNFSANLNCDSDGCDEVLCYHSPSFAPSNPLHFDVLCSLVSNLFFDVQEDKVLDGVGVKQPTYNIIFDEYVWEYEQQSTVKDDLLSSARFPYYPDIFYDSVIVGIGSLG